MNKEKLEYLIAENEVKFNDIQKKYHDLVKKHDEFKNIKAEIFNELLYWKNETDLNGKPKLIGIYKHSSELYDLSLLVFFKAFPLFALFFFVAGQPYFNIFLFVALSANTYMFYPLIKNIHLLPTALKINFNQLEKLQQELCELYEEEKDIKNKLRIIISKENEIMNNNTEKDINIDKVNNNFDYGVYRSIDVKYTVKEYSELNTLSDNSWCYVSLFDLINQQTFIRYFKKDQQLEDLVKCEIINDIIDNETLIIIDKIKMIKVNVFDMLFIFEGSNYPFLYDENQNEENAVKSYYDSYLTTGKYVRHKK